MRWVTVTPSHKPCVLTLELWATGCYSPRSSTDIAMQSPIFRGRFLSSQESLISGWSCVILARRLNGGGPIEFRKSDAPKSGPPRPLQTCAHSNFTQPLSGTVHWNYPPHASNYLQSKLMVPWPFLDLAFQASSHDRGSSETSIKRWFWTLCIQKIPFLSS